MLVRQQHGFGRQLLAPADLPAYTRLLRGRVTQRQALRVDVPFSKIRWGPSLWGKGGNDMRGSVRLGGGGVVWLRQTLSGLVVDWERMLSANCW